MKETRSKSLVPYFYFIVTSLANIDNYTVIVI